MGAKMCHDCQLTVQVVDNSAEKGPHKQCVGGTELRVMNELANTKANLAN